MHIKQDFLLGENIVACSILVNGDNERTKDEFWKKHTTFWRNALIGEKTHDFDDING